MAISISVIFMNRNNSFFPKYFFLLSCVLLFSLRDFSVGTDTINYHDIFYLSRNISNSNINIEPLFTFFNYIVGWVYPSFVLYLFVYSFLFSALWINNIETNVIYNKDIAYICLVCFFGFLLSFNIARQALAMAICVYSLSFLFKEKNLSFLIIILIASLFHYSAILFLIVFILFKFSRFPFTIAFFSFISFYSLSFIGIKFFSSLSIRYIGYTETGGDVTGIFLILFIFLQYALFYFFYKKYFLYDDIYRKIFSVFSFGVGFFIALKVLKIPDDGPVRLSFYFLVVNIFLFPYVFSVFKNKDSLILAKVSFYLFCCFYFFWGINSGAGGLRDYVLNNSIVIF